MKLAWIFYNFIIAVFNKIFLNYYTLLNILISLYLNEKLSS
jgi:hypothetical protein